MSELIGTLLMSASPPYTNEDIVTWTANITGGESPYSFLWELFYFPENPFSGILVATSDENNTFTATLNLYQSGNYGLYCGVTDTLEENLILNANFSLYNEEEEDNEEEGTTNYTTIFDAYLAKVTDDLYLAMTVDELELELTQILEAALPRFLYPKVNLDNRDNITQKFNVVLTNAEIQIISSLMVTEWVTTKIHDIELVRQLYKDHDFNLTSQAAHLRALLAVKSDAIISINKMMSNYYKVNDRSPDFSGLAGG